MKPEVTLSRCSKSLSLLKRIGKKTNRPLSVYCEKNPLFSATACFLGALSSELLPSHPQDQGEFTSLCFLETPVFLLWPYNGFSGCPFQFGNSLFAIYSYSLFYFHVFKWVLLLSQEVIPSKERPYPK